MQQVHRGGAWNGSASTTSSRAAAAAAYRRHILQCPWHEQTRHTNRAADAHPGSRGRCPGKRPTCAPPAPAAAAALRRPAAQPAARAARPGSCGTARGGHRQCQQRAVLGGGCSDGARACDGSLGMPRHGGGTNNHGGCVELRLTPAACAGQGSAPAGRSRQRS